jgi:phage-related protein
MKPVRFLGGSHGDLAAFPESARRDAGYELFMVQVGRDPTDFKSLPRVGPGAYELRVRDEAGVFRVIYVAKFGASGRGRVWNVDIKRLSSGMHLCCCASGNVGRC